MNSELRPPAFPDAVGGLDPTALGRLRELDPDGRNGVVERVLNTYDMSLRRLMGQLEGQRERCDAAAVAGIAHTLKSSSASVGALALSACCAEIEHRLRAGDLTGLADDIERILVEAQAALRAVAASMRT